MNVILKNGLVYRAGGMEKGDLMINGGVVVGGFGPEDVWKIIDCEGKLVVPGLVDVHVHFREPGFEYKETILSGARAAARGGYTQVCTMPNLNPVPDCIDSIKIQKEAARGQRAVEINTYASITRGQRGKGELVDFEALREGAFAFSDDGRGVQSEDLMRKAMWGAKLVGKHIVAHCEDEGWLKEGGCVHEGRWARRNGFVGISSESEWKQVERDINLVRETGCKYHVCHVSTKETVELVRRAKEEGLEVTCETAPHYLILCDEDVRDGGEWKMNPPLRSAEDRAALIAGIKDGTIDMIATDHAPHSEEEKGKGLRGSAFGIVGLEVAFGLMYTHLVEGGVIGMERLVELMALAPRRVFGLGGGVEVGERAEVAVMEVEREWRIDPRGFVGMGKAMPFGGKWVRGRCWLTINGDELTINGENINC